jgi:hypothetical protein
VPDRTTAAKKSPSVRRQSASAPPFFTPSCPAFNGSVTRPVTSLGLPCPAAFGLRWKVCTKVRPRPHDDVRNAAILCGIRLANRCRASVPHGPCEAVSAPAGTAPVSPKSSLLSLKSHRLQVSHLTWAATPLLPRPPQILSLPISFSLRPGDVTEVTVTSQGARSPLPSLRQAAQDGLSPDPEDAGDPAPPRGRGDPQRAPRTTPHEAGAAMAAVTAPWGHAGPSRAQGSGRPRWPLASQRGRTLSRCRPSPTLRPEERGPSAAGGDADRTPGPHPPPPLPAGPGPGRNLTISRLPGVVLRLHSRGQSR